MATLIESATIKSARKRHRCDWCGEHIDIGTSYERQRLADCGDAWVYKAHPECIEAASTLKDYDLECVPHMGMGRGCVYDRFEDPSQCGSDCRHPPRTADIDGGKEQKP